MRILFKSCHYSVQPAWGLIFGTATIRWEAPVHCKGPVLVQVLPDLGLVLVYPLDHFELIEDIIDVEQGCGCRFEGIQKPVVRFA